VSLQADDLREVLTRGLARGGDLLTAGEWEVAQRILRLTGPAEVLYAWLTARVPAVFPMDALVRDDVPDPAAACATLEARGLVDHLVPWKTRAEHLTIPVLSDACRRLGLPTSGRKAELVARLAPHTGWHGGRWIRIGHRGLLARLERWAFLRPWPDRAALTAARIGVVRWPTYALTLGTGLFPHRRALLRWEDQLVPSNDPQADLRALSAGWCAAPAGLDLAPSLRRRVREHARALERDDAPGSAAELYARLVSDGGERAGRVAFRCARALEATGAPEAALTVLQAARADATDAERLGIGRAGRRLSRTLRARFAPERPLPRPRERAIRLPAATQKTHRPQWRTAQGAAPIEEAVCAWLSALGRDALHGEGRPWSTLFALLFAQTYFLPVPGALPIPHLSGPLDLGTPGFRAARRAAVDGVLAAIDAGEGPRRVDEAHRAWRGVRLSGARWDVADRSTLVSLARGIGPAGLRAIMEPLVDGGRRAAAGLPDLAVLPGPAVILPDALPSRLGPGLILAELKGPTDTLRDAQRVWMARLVRAGVAVEVWDVAPPPR